MFVEGTGWIKMTCFLRIWDSFWKRKHRWILPRNVSHLCTLYSLGHVTKDLTLFLFNLSRFLLHYVYSSTGSNGTHIITQVTSGTAFIWGVQTGREGAAVRGFVFFVSVLLLRQDDKELTSVSVYAQSTAAWTEKERKVCLLRQKLLLNVHDLKVHRSLDIVSGGQGTPDGMTLLDCIALHYIERKGDLPYFQVALFWGFTTYTEVRLIYIKRYNIMFTLTATGGHSSCLVRLILLSDL